MHSTSTIFSSSSSSFINPKFPNFNHTFHKFKTIFSYQSPNSLHVANLNNPGTKISSLFKTLKSKIDVENTVNNISNLENAILVLRNLPDETKPETRLKRYNRVFELFMEIRDFKNAENLFDEMLQKGLKPNTLTFSNLIRYAVVCGLPHKAVELFKKMPAFGCEPDYHVFSYMIYAYAHTVLGVEPNKKVYNTLLDRMGKAKRERYAKEIYQEMRKDGLELNWLTYSALLEAYSRERYSKDALSVYKEMKENGLTLNEVLYSMLLDSCADAGYIDEAVEIFEDMKHSETCQPDSHIYTSLINMHACNGNHLEAEAMLNEMISCGLEPNIFVLTTFVHSYGKAKRTDDVVKMFNQLWDFGITPDDQLCDCLLYVMTQIPKEELGKITNCIEKANPKLGNILTYLMEEKEDDVYFVKEVSELLCAANEHVKMSLCNNLIDICYNLGVEDKARDLLGLGLWLEIYSDIQSRSETQWCLNLKNLSPGASITALHVWLDDLSKAFESGEELPQVLGICWRHKPSDKDLACVFESYLKELNSPFYKDTDTNGWVFTTIQEAKSWLHSRGSNETVADLNSTVLDVPNNLSSILNPIPQPLDSLQHAQPEYPDAKSSPNVTQIYEIIKGFGDNRTEHDAGFIVNNMSKPDNGMLVFKYLMEKVKPGKIEEQEEHETYLGYERWLPTPPKVVKPRSVFNATNLAYIGDCIYELYARRHFLFPPLSMVEYSDRVMAVVRCEAQDALLQKLLNSNFLSDQERDVLRWGKNIVSGNSKTKRRAGAAVYNRASSLETLVGYLYLTNVNRLEKLMLELGFSVDSSMPLNLEELITGELNRGKN